MWNVKQIYMKLIFDYITVNLNDWFLQSYDRLLHKFVVNIDKYVSLLYRENILILFDSNKILSLLIIISFVIVCIYHVSTVLLTKIKKIT